MLNTNRNQKIADRTQYTVTAGIMRWNLSNQVPPNDIVAETQTVDHRINLIACDDARKEDFANFMAAYRANGPTADEIAEVKAGIDANFMPGTRVHHMLTGTTYVAGSRK